jgi:hypothetical protein
VSDFVREALANIVKLCRSSSKLGAAGNDRIRIRKEADEERISACRDQDGK